MHLFGCRIVEKSFGGTFCFSNCHIIGLDTVGLVFLVSGTTELPPSDFKQPQIIWNHYHTTPRQFMKHLFRVTPLSKPLSYVTTE
jgi:hypothetical protein